MIITIVILFAAFIALEIYSSSRYFCLGTNPVVLFIYHSVRLGLLAIAMILTWIYSQPLFWGLIVLLLILLGTSLFIGNEKRKIKKIVRIYNNLKKTRPDESEKYILKSTATQYYQSLGWNGDDIVAITKTLFDKSDRSPDDVSTLSAWLLVYEYPNVMGRFSERCKIASKFCENSSK